MKVQVFHFHSFFDLWITRKSFTFHTVLSELERKRSLRFINLVIKFGKLVVNFINEYILASSSLSSLGNYVSSDHALVYWESSMYVQVHTSFGLKVQVQVFPEVELYITPPANNTSPISGSRLTHNRLLRLLTHPLPDDEAGLSFRPLWQQQQRHHRRFHHQQQHRRKFSSAFRPVLESDNVLSEHPQQLYEDR